MLFEEDKCSRIAGCLDKLRIIPRFLLLTGYLFYGCMFVWITQWFMDFPWSTVVNQAVALALAGFPAAILGVLGSVLGGLTKHEMAARSSAFDSPG